MGEVIHYIKGGRSFGPVAVRDFLDMLDQGVLAPDDLVRIEGDGRWQQAGLVADQLRSGRISVRPSTDDRGAGRRASSVPAGQHTVFTSAPPIPKAPLPREAAGLASDSRGCTQCGTHNNRDALFCKRCGTRIAPRACPGCRHPNDTDARFCEQCGTRLDPGPAG